MKNLKSKLWIILTVILTIIFLFAVCNIYIEYKEYSTAQTSYSELSKKVHSSPIDFEALKDINPDIVGWLVVEGTGIDYPIVQGKDNEVYLNTTFEGFENKVGSIFMDVRNEGNFSDLNTVIYGHQMKDGSMFEPLVGYKEQSFYEAHPTFTIYTPESNDTYEVFSALITASDSSVYRIIFQDDEDYRHYLEESISQSLITTGVQVDDKDKIVTLSTCDYTYDEARMVVQGRLVKTTE